jgi:predicted phage baseplate assembly protein
MSFLSTAPTAASPLKAPLKVLHNVLEIGHGKSVAAEILGSGDATLAGQSFALKKSPLTYLPAGDRYRSTLKVYVNDAAWTEVENFYSQPHNATVFVTREDDEQKTHITFGDGTNGARLPTGHDNVVVWYRFGSGANAPAAGALTVIAKPYPGLRALQHPVAGGGGGDPDPASQIRRYAPRSVLTFGRAISADDYEAIASRAPGVARVRAIYGWDAQDQRATVKLHVGDDLPAVDSAREALRLSADPNRTVSVLPATPVPIGIGVLIRVSPDRITADVVAQVRDALLDPDHGLFGTNRIRIGESIYFSQLSAACLGVPGVEALPLALFLLGRPDPVTGLSWVLSGWQPRIAVTEGEFFRPDPQWVVVIPEAPVNV